MQFLVDCCFSMIHQLELLLTFSWFVYDVEKYNKKELSETCGSKITFNKLNMMNKLKRFLFVCLWGMSILSGQAETDEVTNVPDSVYLFSYASADGSSGLRLAWSHDGNTWESIASGFEFVKCDFGPWGIQKKMFNPRLMYNRTDGNWRCIWTLTSSGKAMAYADSPDLLKWGHQSHFRTEKLALYEIQNAEEAIRKQLVIDGTGHNGWVQKVPYSVVEQLFRYTGYKSYQQMLSEESTVQDTIRFAGLKPVNAVIRINTDKSKTISDHLIGIFFEDINYSADGGLYAELIQNRDFEYTSGECDKKDWNALYSWRLQGNNTSLFIETAHPVHSNNPHYAILDVQEPGAVLFNSGFDGIAVKKGEKYDFSLFAKMLDGKKGKLKVTLVTEAGKELAQATISVSGKSWKKRSIVFTASDDAGNALLAISPQSAGQYAMDMISLFPRNTFKGRRNGLRADLAQILADLHPRFVRFPGGCVAHGDGVDNIYDWKGSIGPLESRKPMRNSWGYHQTRGLGYFEYFLFCEDIGAEPLPVLAAGVPCQNSRTPSRHSTDEISSYGQQGGIPMAEMGTYIQDILDLIEYANGDAEKTVWGKKRAEAGHPEPFNLKYIGIGNEDVISGVFKERFTMIFNAIREKHPEITVIGTVGPFFEGTDYDEGWALATELGVPMVDEHYYVTPGWFINHQNYYDHYDRTKSKVYLGEYAAHGHGRICNIETALAEALYLTAVERNGDIVSMASYAPLLANEKHIQWSPDLIYFNNSQVKPTVSYYVQQMYGHNSGNKYIASNISLDNTQSAVKKRIGVSVVREGSDGDLIVKLVNMLPVNVKTSVELPSSNGWADTVTKTVLVGKPQDREVRPLSGTIQMDKSLLYEMPAYSFTVLRIHKNGQK